MEAAMSAFARLAIAAGTAAAIISFAEARTAEAQDTNIRRLLSPEETRQCICEEAEIEGLRAKMAESDPLQQEFDHLDKIVENARPILTQRMRRRSTASAACTIGARSCACSCRRNAARIYRS
jgi:hypothetical protein